MGGDREGDWVEGVGHLQGPELPLGLAPLGLEVFSPRSWRLLEGHGMGWGVTQTLPRRLGPPPLEEVLRAASSAPANPFRGLGWQCCHSRPFFACLPSAGGVLSHA